MRRLSLPIALASLSLISVAAVAQPIAGLYFGGGVGANFLDNENIRSLSVNGSPVATGAKTGLPGGVTFKPGFSSVVSAGYGLGNGVRFELEASLRGSQRDYGAPPADMIAAGTTFKRTGNETKAGAMFNVLFDTDIGSAYVYPYLGAGIGYQNVSITQKSFETVAGEGTDSLHFAGTRGALGYQGIVGAALPIPNMPGLSATAEYRYLGLSGDRTYYGTEASTAYGSTTIERAAVKLTQNSNHQVMIGLRYAFNVMPPPPFTPVVVHQAPPAPMAAAPAPAPARTYMVFFDWDKAELTDRAQLIVAEAAKNATRGTSSRIDVAGHADKTGAATYNQALSLSRANNVANELVRLGVPKSAISITAFGDTKPLVPTAEGVREPQNRRVEIVLK